MLCSFFFFFFSNLFSLKQSNAHHFNGSIMKPFEKRLRVAEGSFSPESYLGQTVSNEYEPICIAWSAVDEWKPNCGALWYSPRSMKLPTVCEVKEEGVPTSVQYVPIEYLMVINILFLP